MQAEEATVKDLASKLDDLSIAKTASETHLEDRMTMWEAQAMEAQRHAKQHEQMAVLMQSQGHSDWIGKYQSLHTRHAELVQREALHKAKFEKAHQVAELNFAKLEEAKESASSTQHRPMRCGRTRPASRARWR